MASDYTEESYNSMEEILMDPRFSHITTDPRYRNAPVKDIKVELDSRFKTALTNERFNSKSLMDPRGRPKSYGTKEKMDKFYRLQSSEDESAEDSESEEDSENEETSDSECEKESKKEDEEENNDENKDENEVEHVKHNNQKIVSKAEVKNVQMKESDKDPKFLRRLLDPERDMARGYDYFSEDSSDDDSSTTDEDEPNEEFEWGELDGDAQWVQDDNDFEETNRFAVCNMDWDNIKAVDLMMLFSSFAPAGGAVKKVSILPSEFGKKRLEEEEVSGPQELVRLVASKNKKCDELIKDLENIEKGKVDETAEATLLQLEALRKYQRNRMLYYYAVCECDSVDTASTIYKECDRMLYELSGVIVDLRYIPNDMQFDQVPRDVCEKTLDSYNQETFHSTGFNASKPSLSWDETDRRRTNAIANVMTSVMQKKDFDENAIKDFVAMSDNDDDEDESDNYHISDDDTDGEDDSDDENGVLKKEKRISKFRSLISEIEEKEQRKKKEKLVFEADENDDDDDEDDQDESEQESESDDNEGDNLTPFEKYLSKRREKRKEKTRNKKKIDEDEENNENLEEESEENVEKDVKRLKEEKNKKKNNWRNKRKEKLQSQENDKPEEIQSSLSLLVMDEEESNKKHFDMRKINGEKKNNEKMKQKGKRKNENINLKDIDDFKVDSTDPRFAAMYSHGGFNLDPSHSRFNPHSSYNLMANRPPKKQKTENEELKIYKKPQQDRDVFNLVNKIKRKTGKFK